MRGGEGNLPTPKGGRMQTKPVGTQSEARPPTRSEHRTTGRVATARRCVRNPTRVLATRTTGRGPVTSDVNYRTRSWFGWAPATTSGYKTCLRADPHRSPVASVQLPDTHWPHQ